MARRRSYSEATSPLENTSQTPRTSRLGAYRVVAPLARGGTSGVYLGEHATTRERVALKVLDPFYSDNADIAARLLAERTVSEHARHPGLVEVALADRSSSGVPYIVMEYLDGESLAALLDRGDLEQDGIIAMVVQIAEALGAMHAAGFIHCDIKPSNIIVLYQIGYRGWPRIKVIDYGVARRIEDRACADTTIAGTPSYMAPEQWRGEPCAKSDVYALGCLLYELLTGEPVFSGTLPQLMLAHSERLPVRPSEYRAELPPVLERLVMRTLAKDPALRPGMAELELELARFLRIAETAPRCEPAQAMLAAAG